MGRYVKDPAEPGHPGGGNGKNAGLHGKGQTLGGELGDHLMGTKDADLIEGYAGRDNLIGFAGEDTLVGGEDADNLSGGADADLLVGGLYDAVEDVASGDGATDTISLGYDADETDEEGDDEPVDAAEEGYAADTIRALELSANIDTVRAYLAEDEDDDEAEGEIADEPPANPLGDILDVKDVAFDFAAALATETTLDPETMAEVTTILDGEVTAEELAAFVTIEENEGGTGSLVVNTDGEGDDGVAIAVIASVVANGSADGAETTGAGFEGLTLCVETDALTVDETGTVVTDTVEALAIWTGEGWEFV